MIQGILKRLKNYLVDKMKISIVGIGMFGFALARNLGNKYLGDDNIKIMAYDSNKESIEHLKKFGSHLYHFGNKKLPSNIAFATDKQELIMDADIVILAITSQAIRAIVREIKDYLKNDVIILNTAKALEISTGKIFLEVIKEEMIETSINYTIAKLSGGTFAQDLVNDAPLGADIACENPYALKKLQDIFHSKTFSIYGNLDLIGVEYAGALKNVIAIFAGIIKGLGLPYGSETHMISRAANEAKEISVALGAKPHTFSMESQCWGNDLWMSCTGNSRNREFGKLIGKGLSLKDALDKMQTENKLVEGYYTTEMIPKLCEKANVYAPIFNEIYGIVCKENDAVKSIKHLMNRELEYAYI
jgi:glycerol-3-phosphate dehydrogenase (NAD(P)+)